MEKRDFFYSIFAAGSYITVPKWILEIVEETIIDDQPRTKVVLETNYDNLPNSIECRIYYMKPDETRSYVKAKIRDKTKVVADININSVGQWAFWVYAEFPSEEVVIGRAVFMKQYHKED